MTAVGWVTSRMEEDEEREKPRLSYSEVIGRLDTAVAPREMKKPGGIVGAQGNTHYPMDNNSHKVKPTCKT